MRKIKDRILLGTVCGIASATIGKYINAAEYKLGLTDVQYNQLAATLFMPKNKINTPKGKLLGGIINNINVGSVGVLISYILSATGRDKAALKGMGVTAITWVMINGLLAKQVLGVKSKKPLTPFLSLFDHLFYGYLTATMISKFGDDRLFPEPAKKSEKKLPLIALRPAVKNDKR
ncbi:MAG: hypothetical protein AB1420_06530 [Bacillota bacterium]